MLPNKILDLVYKNIEKDVMSGDINISYVNFNTNIMEKKALKKDEIIEFPGEKIKKYKKVKKQIEKKGLSFIGNDFILLFVEDIVTKKNNREIQKKGGKTFIGKSSKLKGDEKYLNKVIDYGLTNKQELELNKIKDNITLNKVLNILNIDINKIKKEKLNTITFNNLRENFNEKDGYSFYLYFKGKERVKDIDNSFVLMNDVLEKTFNENGINFNDNKIFLNLGHKNTILLDIFDKKKVDIKGINVFYYKFL